MGRGRRADPARPGPARTADGQRTPAATIRASRRCRAPASAGTDRIRVVEVLATGTSGGAQEHVFGLVSRMDPDRFDVSVVSLSSGSAVRKLQRAGVRRPRHRRARRRDRGRRTGRAPRRCPARRHPQPHVPRRARRHAGGDRASARSGHRRPYIVSTVHSSRVRSEEDREMLRAADAADGPAHRGVQDDRGQARSRKAGRRARSGASTTASTCRATTTPSRAARSPRSTAWSRAPRSSASWRGSSPRRATRRCSRRGRRCCAPFRTPTC